MKLKTVDLRREAAAEAARLTMARALMHDGDERALASLDGGAPWIAVARRSPLKRLVGRRVLMLWRACVEDASGRLVESRLVAVLVAVADGVDARTLALDAGGAIGSWVNASCEEWRADVSTTVCAFVQARLRRQHDVTLSRPSPAPLSQPGLFDRRAGRSLEARLSDAGAFERTTLDRQRDVVAAGTITFTPPQLLLVLVP